jgi:15-cis-phytoene desaturase
VIYIDSPWALTSISQAQFWAGIDLTTRGNGKVHGILSVDVSDWDSPGVLYGKPAMDCTKEEVVAEVIAQVRAHLAHSDSPLGDDDIDGWFVDSDIRYPNPRQDINLEPLLVNTSGSWDLRPDAATAIPNLVLASDYVRTYTDLATMEGANEAARRAVNAILDASGSTAPRCGVWPLIEPKVFHPIKAVDAEWFRVRYHDHSPVGPGTGQ